MNTRNYKTFMYDICTPLQWKKCHGLMQFWEKLGAEVDWTFLGPLLLSYSLLLLTTLTLCLCGNVSIYNLNALWKDKLSCSPLILTILSLCLLKMCPFTVWLLYERPNQHNSIRITRDIKVGILIVLEVPSVPEFRYLECSLIWYKYLKILLKKHSSLFYIYHINHSLTWIYHLIPPPVSLKK